MMPEYRISEFVCLRCGNCCRGDGCVWLSRDDVTRIARHLGLKRGEFLRRFTRRVEDRLALTDQPGPERACVFYEEGVGCAIHSADWRI